MGFCDGVGFHELGAEFFGAREVINVDFEEVFEGLVGGDMGVWRTAYAIVAIL